jgi:tRNA-modifying protein YgfZ
MAVSRSLHEAHGVRWERDGSSLPRNYGDPAAEYRAARIGTAIVDRCDRRFIRVHGRDPVRMIQGLVSNDVAGAAAGRATYAAVLTPKGRMVADVRVVKRGAELLLETDAAAADPLAEHLRKFVPPLFARFEDAGEARAALGLHGPGAHALLAAVAAGPVPDVAPEDVVGDVFIEDIPVLVVTTSQLDVPGYDVICPAEAVDAVWSRLVAAGATPMGHATLDVLRIEAGRPRWGAELDGAVIPLEAGLRERAISETKGCYTGQEVIIRILHRGHVNRLLRGLLLGDGAAPGAGAVLVREADGREVGRVTSVAWSPRHGQEIGLAYVRREVEPPATLRLASVEGPPVQVVALPFSPPG